MRKEKSHTIKSIFIGVLEMHVYQVDCLVYLISFGPAALPAFSVF